MMKNNALPLFMADNKKIALIHDGQSISYDKLNQWIDNTGAFLLEQGIHPGERFAVNLDNGLCFALLFFASIQYGFSFVPIDIQLPRIEQEHMLDSANPLKIIQRPFDYDKESKVKPTARNTFELVTFSSGTTHRPRGIVHNETLIQNALAFNECAGLDSQTRLLHVMPMAYMAGLLVSLLCPLLAGGTVVLCPAFSASRANDFWHEAMSHQVNALSLTPYMAALLTRISRGSTIEHWSKKHLKHVLVGTTPLAKVTKANFNDKFGIALKEYYSLAELAVVSVNQQPGVEAQGAVGQCLKGIDVEIRNHADETVAVNESGHIYVKSPYHYSYELSHYQENSIGHDVIHFINTGDIGHIDEAGHLFITGREKEIIIKSALNVSQTAVAEVLLAYNKIIDVAVIALPHPILGEEVAAFIVLEPEAKVSNKELREYCLNELGEHATPTMFNIVDEIPRSPLGVVKKDELKKI